MAPTPSPPPKLSSSNSSSSLSDHFPNLRQFFTRSASQPSQQQQQPNDDKHAHVRSSSVTLSSSSLSFSSPVDPDADARAQALGSCTQVLATAITALFRAINSSGVYSHERADNSTTRSAKLLYVQLLDRAQRERGEWCGFADTTPSSSSSGDAQQKRATKSASDILATHLHNLSRDETFALLNELVDVSFRSMRGPLVSAEIYVKHKKPLAVLSLGIPVSLHALLEIRAILNELGRDEKLCIFRLLTLWHAMAVASEAQDLRRTIQEKHPLVFSDCTELEFLTSRRDPRHDAVAIALLQILVLYHDVLFSDVEFLLIKQELQLSDSLRRTRVVSETTETTEPTSSESKPEPPVDAADHSETSTSPPLSSQDEQSERLATTTKENEDAAQESESKPEAGMSSSMNQDPRLSEAPPATTVDSTPSLPESQSETQSAACEDKHATPEHAAVPAAEDGSALVQQAPAERSSQQQPPREQQKEPSQTEAATASSSPQLRVSTMTTTPHIHSHTRTHGPVVSIRPHSLSPRKSRQTKRFAFEAINVNTAITSEQRQSHPHHNTSASASPKSDGARQATPLWNDAVRFADYCGKSSSSSPAEQQQHVDDSKCPARQVLDYDTVAVRRVEQHSPAAKASPVDLPTTAERDQTRDLQPQEEQEDKEVGSNGCNSDSLQKSARRSSSSSSSASALKPSPPHEITDLASTYFSFSFAAATMRTMAIMAFYAIRRHQHQQ
ncbi:hypothetical protein Gpo141_00008420 [Globisporangium polare]